MNYHLLKKVMVLFSYTYYLERPAALCKWPTWRTVLFYVFIFVFNSLQVSSTSCSSSGETNCVNTASGSCHSVSVAVSCAGRKVVLTQFISPDDEHDVLETCRELKIKIHRKELCVTLVIYQESLHDAGQQNIKLPLLVMYLRYMCHTYNPQKM
jgi:hypothetical protein